MTHGKAINNKYEEFSAAYATDKDYSTKAGAALRDGDDSVWLKLDFGKTNFIHRVKIYHQFYTNWYDPRDPCVPSQANFKECVDYRNNVDMSVYQGEEKQKSCGTLQLTYGLEQSDQIYTLICNTEGDNVKLSKKQDRIMVYEIIVTGKGYY